MGYGQTFFIVVWGILLAVNSVALVTDVSSCNHVSTGTFAFDLLLWSVSAGFLWKNISVRLGESE
jgi:hypothetical protein